MATGTGLVLDNVSLVCRMHYLMHYISINVAYLTKFTVTFCTNGIISVSK